MKRKISMFAVTLCLTAAMLTGCGGNKNGTTTSPAPAASTDNATETPKNTPEASAEAEGTSKPSATEKAADDGDNAGNAPAFIHRTAVHYQRIKKSWYTGHIDCMC